MGWKTLMCAVTVLTVMLHQAYAKPVNNKRGPPHPDPVEAGSKEEEALTQQGILKVLTKQGVKVLVPKGHSLQDPAEDEEEEEEEEKEEEKGTQLEYDGYLRQVVEALESDSEFRKKLESTNASDIRSGAIAMHLELVNHSIRNQLDEIKRMEVKRLQELALAKMKSMSGTQVLHFIAAHGGVGVNRMDIPSHLDLRNPHSFEMKDLENLIKKTTHDLEEVDKKRKQQFKTYEMEKEFEYQEKLKSMTEEEKKAEEKKHQELKEKHKQHEKINHPGSKDQFEEVWEKEDHLEDQDFDPKTFFLMHDLNNDRMWDIQEVEAVLQRELDKVYDARNSPEEDDPNERFEEMSRMREHVFTEIDTNKDFMITLDEFINYTGKTGDSEKFKEDEGWETLDETDQFTDDEFQEYMRQHHPGNLTPKPDTLQFVPEGQVHPQQGMPQQGMPQHQQGMPQQGMPQHQQGMPQQGMPQQGMPEQGIAQQVQQGMHQQGMPQHQQGMPQQGMPQHQQGMPQQGMPQQGMPQHQQGMPQHQQGMPQQGMPQQGMPQHQQGMPQQGMPQQGMPQQQPGQVNAGQPPAPHQGQGQPVHNQPPPV
ncbi:nucleobindin-2-like isoform X2 [Babylonia areolata]|uniref:nucleobindin-2-like isoform X2 n=1 Tax=Babylonia areolata TaxID=304850 RepID=UPI003FD64174